MPPDKALIVGLQPVDFFLNGFSDLMIPDLRAKQGTFVILINLAIEWLSS